MKKVITLLTSSLLLGQVAYANEHTSEWHDLLDANLSQFETWIGVPHTSVKGLPAGTYQSDTVTKGQAMGLENDPLNIFTVVEQDDETILKVTGQIYGGINTKKDYGNYHLKFQFRWGDKRWEPRLTKKRDSGLLYHCEGEHGAFWNTWKACLEYQIQESDIGDFLGLKGPYASFRGYEVNKETRIDKRSTGKFAYDPNSEQLITTAHYTNAYIENDAPHGNWNTVELFAVGDEAVHVVNGQVVVFVQDIKRKGGETLTKGQIQFQSEAAEIDYKDMKIRSIKRFPEHIEAQFTRFKSE